MTSRQLENRRRRERVAGIALAALGVGVLIIALVALRSPNGHGKVADKGTTTTKPVTSSPAKSSPAKSSPAKSSGATTPTAATSSPVTGKLPLVVLNNTSVSGLAEQARTRFEAGGWTVTSTASLSNDIVSTCAYFDPAVEGAEAAAQALQTQFPAIKRVVPKFAELPAGPVVVVLTSDYS